MDEGRKPLRFAGPSPFAHFLRPFGSNRPAPNEAMPGEWIEVSGGGLPTSLLVRIERREDGQFVVTGLVMGRQGHEELTWESLRSVRPAAILADLFQGLDPREPWRKVHDQLQPFVQEGDGAEFDLDEWKRDDEDLPDASATDDREFSRAHAAAQLWSRLRKGGARTALVRASVATDLEKFAEVYMRHLAATPRRATTATAEELNMSRATANRRLVESRNYGLIPQAKGRASDD